MKMLAGKFDSINLIESNGFPNYEIGVLSFASGVGALGHQKRPEATSNGPSALNLIQPIWLNQVGFEVLSLGFVDSELGFVVLKLGFMI